MGTAVRRSSTAFNLPIVRSGSPSPSERERDSDSASIKGTSKPSSLKTATLSPPVGNEGVVTASPIAESPAREAAALAAEPAGPSPLAGEDVISASPEPTLEPPVINEVPPSPATAVAAEQTSIIADSKTASTAEEDPAAEEEPVVMSTSDAPTEQKVVPAVEEKPAAMSSDLPTETGEQRAPSINVEDPPAEQAPTEPAASTADVPAQEMARSISSEASVVEQSAPGEPGPVSYFDMAAPQPVVPPSVDYSTQIWGQDSKGGVSASQSNASLASSVGWSDAKQNENGGYDQKKPAIE